MQINQTRKIAYPKSRKEMNGYVGFKVPGTRTLD